MADYLVECGKSLRTWQSDLTKARDKGKEAANIIKDEVLPTVRIDVSAAAEDFGIENLEECVSTYANKIPNQTLKNLIECVSKRHINVNDAKLFLKGLYDWSGILGKAAIAVALKFLRSDWVGIPVSTKDEQVAKDIISIAGQASKSEM